MKGNELQIHCMFLSAALLPPAVDEVRKLRRPTAEALLVKVSSILMLCAGIFQLSKKVLIYFILLNTFCKVLNYLHF